MPLPLPLVLVYRTVLLMLELGVGVELGVRVGGRREVVIVLTVFERGRVWEGHLYLRLRRA